MDDFDAPTCPDCGTVLRDAPGAFVCRCGYRVELPEVEMPPEFDGPSINGG